MVPVAPISTAWRVSAMVSRVLMQVVPTNTGTRPAAASTIVFMKTSFSSSVMVAASPRVPMLRMPSTPASMRPLTIRAASSTLTVSVARQSEAPSLDGVGTIAQAPFTSAEVNKLRATKPLPELSVLAIV